MTRSGFSLFELLLYCFLLSILVLLLFTWIHTAQSSLRKTNNTMARVMSEHTIIDVLTRDLQQAPAQLEQWEVASGNAVIWRSASESIGWQQENGALFRYAGNRRNGQWVDFTKSLMSEQAHKVSFNCATVVYHNNDTASTHTQVREIQCMYNEHTTTIALRNRRLHDAA